MRHLPDIIDLRKELADSKRALAGQILAPGFQDWVRFWMAMRDLACFHLETETDHVRLMQLQNEIRTIDSQLRLPKDLDEMRQQPPSSGEETGD